ncbi:beta-lactamase-like protein [Mycena crocata]|nr:beta-lactamase-like protein [Mycena crocata]
MTMADDDDLLLCIQCGTQYGVTEGLTECHICDDPRESVAATGHAFTTLGKAKSSRKYKNIIRQQYKNEPHIYTIQTQSILGIGQRCFLIKTAQGNILWDCIAYIDDATIKEINALGGVDAISISHPHFYTSHLTWSRAFKNAPVFLSAEEGHLISRPDEHGVRRFVTNKKFEILPGSGATRIKTGGHFPGSAVLHYKNSMFVSDSLHVTRSALWDINRKPGTSYYAFLWSHVNTIPLPPGEIAGIISAISPYEFDVAHGMFPDRDLRSDAKQRAIDSARVVINAMGHDADKYLSLA